MMEGVELFLVLGVLFCALEKEGCHVYVDFALLGGGAGSMMRQAGLK